jgi:hypothetical protein
MQMLVTSSTILDRVQTNTSSISRRRTDTYVGMPLLFCFSY